MQITDPELLNKLAIWRRKSADGTVSLEEMRAAVIALRQNRISALTEAKASKRSSSSKTPPQSADSLLNELDKL